MLVVLKRTHAIIAGTSLPEVYIIIRDLGLLLGVIELISDVQVSEWLLLLLHVLLLLCSIQTIIVSH